MIWLRRRRERRAYAAWRRKADQLLGEWQRAIDALHDATDAWRAQPTAETENALEVALSLDAITARAVAYHYDHKAPNPDDWKDADDG